MKPMNTIRLAEVEQADNSSPKTIYDGFYSPECREVYKKYNSCAVVSALCTRRELCLF